MRILSILVVFLCFSAIFGDDSYRCDWILSPTVDCNRFAADPTCGTNIITYTNKCTYSQAHCVDTSINVKHYGNCTSADGTTQLPVTVPGHDVVFDFMCTSLSHMNCPVGGEVVCADDGYTYDNYCEYEKQKCTHRNLNVIDCPLV